jgi:undecaprenyl diphosphate synthase
METAAHQSFVSQSGLKPHHTAIIMDGNGRWANLRNLPRCMGHREGSRALRRAVEAAPGLGIRVLTLYAFSSDNWKRPRAEVEALMDLLTVHLRSEAEHCREQGVRMQMIGRRDRLPHSVIEAARHAEIETAQGDALLLRLAVDYSGRESILRSAIGQDVDLLIRTGGEQRLSDFLLWESAYAELVFIPCLWPDFAQADLAQAVAIFEQRERRFGRTADEAESALGQLNIQDVEGTFSQLRGDRWLR